MPAFLESALRHEYGKKGLRGKELDARVFEVMNSVGAVKGNKETAKGREMERKHESMMQRVGRKARSRKDV
jgi:hypothetical protein